MKSFPVGARLFAAALLVYAVCPPFTSYDSYYTVPAALSLLRHGTTAVDEYVRAAPPEASYAAEWTGDHWENFYPHAVSFLALPPIAAIQAGTSILAKVWPAAASHAPHPAIAAFLSGDLAGGRPIVELLCGALFGALAVWAQYRIALGLVERRVAVWYALLFAFGTAEWSTASRNLMQHGLSILLLSVAMWMLIAARERPGVAAYASLPLALAFTVRPSNCIPAAVMGVYVVVRHRRELARFAVFAAAVASLFVLHNWQSAHRLVPRYFVTPPGQMAAGAGFVINLVSPSRGLFVYTPIFLFSCAGLALAFRTGWLRPLPAYLAVTLALHSVLIASCWPGHCFGPRYFADMTPILMLLLIPVFEFWRKLPGGGARWAVAAGFVLCAAWSVFVNARGATSVAAIEWSKLPVNVDEAQWRVWDWSDPQFLRGLR